jgi:hypothetical protein
LGAPDIETVIDEFTLELGGPIYDDVHGTLFVEVRDFGKPERTLVIRTMIDGNPVTTMVSWEKFTDQLDDMRARMMGNSWDEALAVLTGRSG